MYRDCHDFPFGHYSAPFELKTHGTDRADFPLLQAISGEGRFRKNWDEFPFGKRVPSTVTASGAARLLLVNAAAPLTGCGHWRCFRLSAMGHGSHPDGCGDGDGEPVLPGRGVIDGSGDCSGEGAEPPTGRTLPDRPAFPGQISHRGSVQGRY